MNNNRYLILYKYINKLLLFISFSIFLYILFLLISNISSGFDITDESYYILAGLEPNDIFSTIQHDGYYTRLLYLLSGYSLPYVRLLGLFILLGASIWFAYELLIYVSKKFNLIFDIWDKLSFMMYISIGSLSYYRWWLITPSYNWLTLVSTILLFTMLLKIINNVEINYNKYLSLDYFLFSFFLSMSFMSKPTSALVFAIISILFLVYEFKNIHLKKALPSIVFLTSVIIALHIYFLDGGFSLYYNRLIEGMNRLAILGGGYTVYDRYKSMMRLLQSFFFDKFYFHQISNFYFYGFMCLVASLFIFRKKIKSLEIYMLVMAAVLVVYSYFMYRYGSNQILNLMWIRTVELLLLNLLLIFFGILFINKKIEYLKLLLKILPLLFIIVLGSFVYSFGTNGNIVYAMSGGIIFLMAPVLVLNYTFDKTMPIQIFSALIGLIVSTGIYLQISSAYEHPYRLITNIKNQNQKVNFLGGLRVDKITQKYIEDLQKIEKENRLKDKELSLIDMTGATPGANIVLNAKFFGFQWLAGGYPGSNRFVLKILNPYKGTKKLRYAWILTAANGRRKLDLRILKYLGLNFPDDYIKIGTVRTAYRDEIQEVWKPIFY